MRYAALDSLNRYSGIIRVAKYKFVSRQRMRVPRTAADMVLVITVQDIGISSSMERHGDYAH